MKTRAAFREMKEEIGTDKAQIIAESKDWLCYEVPPDFRQRWGDRSRWRGQQQKSFVMRFDGLDADVNLATEHSEFLAWQWVPVDQLPELAISFKKQLYLDILDEFRHAVVTSIPTRERCLAVTVTAWANPEWCRPGIGRN